VSLSEASSLPWQRVRPSFAMLLGSIPTTPFPDRSRYHQSYKELNAAPPDIDEKNTHQLCVPL